MKQLVSSWVEAECDESGGYGHNLSEAIAYLSRECGITLNHSRLAEWRAGKYTPSPPVITQMLYRVLPWALWKVGFEPTDAQLDALEDLIFTVNVVDGDRQIELPQPHGKRQDTHPVPQEYPKAPVAVPKVEPFGLSLR